MGKGAGKKSQDILTGTSAKFSQTMDQLLSESEPARKIPMNFWSSIIKGGPEADAVLAPSTESIRSQFEQARAAIERSLPRGGAMDNALTQTHIAEAGTVGSQRTNLLSEAVARLASMGVFGTQSGISAGGGSLSAGNSLANLSGMQAQAWGTGLGGLAEGVGSIFGGKKSGG